MFEAIEKERRQATEKLASISMRKTENSSLVVS